LIKKRKIREKAKKGGGGKCENRDLVSTKGYAKERLNGGRGGGGEKKGDSRGIIKCGRGLFKQIGSVFAEGKVFARANLNFQFQPLMRKKKGATPFERIQEKRASVNVRGGKGLSSDKAGSSAQRNRKGEGSEKPVQIKCAR